MHGVNQSHVSGGRRALAAALSKHEGALMNLLSPFGLEAAEVQARAALHLRCADMKSCDSKFLVGGRSTGFCVIRACINPDSSSFSGL